MTAAAAGLLDAIVLAGGRGRRAGGADKPSLRVAGRPLLASVVAAAVEAGARRVVVVGPPRPQALAGQPLPTGGLVTVREQPPGAGPVPALRRGLAEVSAPVVAVLAADLPFVRGRHLRRLHGAVAAGTGPPDAAPAGAVLSDEEGRPQWLTGCWQTRRLRAAARGYSGGSLHGLLGPLAPVLLRYELAAGEPPPWLDCDTAGELQRAQAWQAAARLRESSTGREGTLVSTLEQWTHAVCAELGIDEDSVDVRAVLDLARDVARGVDRPAAPLTAYLLGIAVGRGMPAAAVSERLTGLAQGWAAQRPEDGRPPE